MILNIFLKHSECLKIVQVQYVHDLTVVDIYFDKRIKNKIRNNSSPILILISIAWSPGYDLCLLESGELGKI